MTGPTSQEELTRLLREFMANLREHFKSRLTEDGPEAALEKIFGAIVAAGAAILLLLPWGRRREGLIGALLAAAARYLAKRTVPRA